jgi:hypothetical protein
LPRSAWDGIRRHVYAEGGYKCGICATKGVLHAHEVWSYNEKSKVQKLEGLIALCSMCHHVKHFLLSQKLASEGKLNLESVIQHFMKINECDRFAFEKHLQASFYLWKKRSSHQWQTDMSCIDERYKDVRTNRSYKGKNLQSSRKKK